MESIKFTETWNRKQCKCESIHSGYTHPLTSFFHPPEIEELELDAVANYRASWCRTCKGIRVYEQKDFEPSIYDLPQILFNIAYLSSSYLENKSLKQFAKEITKAEILRQEGVGPKKVEAINQVLKSYGIKWT